MSLFDIHENFTARLRATRYQTLEDFEQVGERLRASVGAERIVIRQDSARDYSLRFLFSDPLAVGYSAEDFLADCEAEHSFGELPFAVDELGNSVRINLLGAPHALLAGTSGSGKSVGLNALLWAMASASEPLQLFLCDPKKVELKPWEPLAFEYSTGEAMASTAQRVQGLMLDRYSEMEERGVRNLAKDDPELLADLGGIIVLVVDELAEALAVGGKDLGLALSSIAQMGRACGVFLVTATQNPKADLFSKSSGTETLRSNLSNLVAFRVLRRPDSDVILGSGEEKDASKISELYPGTAFCSFSPERIRVPYLTDEKIADLVKGMAEKLKQGEKNENA